MTTEITDIPVGNYDIVEEPRRVPVVTTASYSEVIASGFLNNLSTPPKSYLHTDIFEIIYDYSEAENTGTFGIFLPTFSGSTITLSLWVNSGNVSGATVVGNLPKFNNVTGQIIDSGISPSNPAKTKAVMADGATVAGYVMVSTDTAGTVGNSGIGATAKNNGSFQAGSPSVGGAFTSFSTTAASGALVVKAGDSSLNTTTTLTHADMGQNTSFIIPDPGVLTTGVAVFGGNINVGHTVKVSTAGGVLIDNGVGIFGGVTDTWGGGSATHDFTATGAIVGMHPVATLATSTSATATTVRASVPSTNVLRVVFTADPGANTSVNWIASFT